MDIELLRLQERIETGLELGESHFREFKSACERDATGEASPRNPKEICRDIGEVLVSFANADGGELLVGIENDARVTGIPHKEALLASMEQAYISHVHGSTPLPTPTVRRVTYGGQTILYFSIPKSTVCVHLTSDGRCLQRFDKENRPVAVERVQYERQEQLSREYDRAYVDGATTKDLDLQLLDSVGKQIASGYSPEKLLQFLDLAVHTNEGGLRLTRAALLLFAKEIARWHPRCEVRILRIAGAELGTGPQYNVTQDDVIRGNITAILEKAWESLRPYLARTRFHGDAVFRESIMYPDVACREGLVNAIAHRDYSAEGRPVEILVFEDRLEIKSPGSLLSSIKLESLVRLERPHQSRNVLIARVLRELGYMREMGEGIPRIFHTMRESDLVDPELRSEANAFVVILRNTSVFSPRDVEWLKAYADFDLDRNEQKVVLLGRDSHLLSTNEIIRLLGIVDMDVFRALYEKMRRKGVIFNAKPRSQGSGVRRREEGRFQIRPPSEAQQYLNELLAQVQPIVAARVTLVPLPKSITEGLSPGSPYRENPSWGLHDLGFIDNRGQWLPKAKALVPAPQPAAKPTVMPASGQAESRKQGVIRWKNEMQGFGFISGTDGQEYYMHASFLAPPLVWKELSLGTKVSFRVAERQIAGRARATADIRLDS